MVTDMPVMDFQALGQAVRARREALGLSLVAVRDRGGPAVATLQKIEGGVPAEYRTTTIRPLERALQWAPGSAKRVLEGGQAVEEVRSEEELEAERDTRVRSAVEEQFAYSVAHRDRVRVSLLTAMTILNVAGDAAADPDAGPTVQRLIGAAGGQLQDVVRTLGYDMREFIKDLPEQRTAVSVFGLGAIGTRAGRRRYAEPYESVAGDSTSEPTEADLREQHEAAVEDAATAKDRGRQDESDGA